VGNDSNNGVRHQRALSPRLSMMMMALALDCHRIQRPRMTLNAKIWVFYRLFGDFRLRDTFQEQNAPKTIKIDVKKLRMKFSALNLDFDGPSLDFLGSRKPAHEGIKERYPRKGRYFTVVGQSFVKTVADRYGHAAYHNKH